MRGRESTRDFIADPLHLEPVLVYKFRDLGLGVLRTGHSVANCPRVTVDLVVIASLDNKKEKINKKCRIQGPLGNEGYGPVHTLCKCESKANLTSPKMERVQLLGICSAKSGYFVENLKFRA